MRGENGPTGGRPASPRRDGWLPVAPCLLQLALLGCGPAPPASTAAPPAAAGRVIALAPSLVESLFALGLGDRVVGVGDYTTWPPEALALPRLGGLLDARLEAIAALAPDLAVLLPGEADLAARLERLGVDVLIVPHETLADVEAGFLAIAERCGAAAAGGELAARWRADLAPAPVAGAPRTLLVVGRQEDGLREVTAAGPGSFLGELLELAGADNAADGLRTTYPRLGPEGILGLLPEAVVELSSEPVADDGRAALIAAWASLPSLPANRRGCIDAISGGHVMIPGPRLPLLYRELRAILAACAARRPSLSAAPSRHPFAPASGARPRRPAVRPAA